MPYDHVPFIDNQPVLTLIETKPNGIFALLDDEVGTPLPPTPNPNPDPNPYPNPNPDPNPYPNPYPYP